MVLLGFTCLEPDLPSSVENNLTFDNASRAADGNHPKVTVVLGYFRYTVKSSDGTLDCFTHRTLSAKTHGLK